MTNTPQANTFEVHGGAGSSRGYFVVERRHDGRLFKVTDDSVRCVSGPYTDRQHAQAEADRLAAPRGERQRNADAAQREPEWW